VDDLLEEIRVARRKNERVLVTTLTKAHGGRFVRIFYRDWREVPLFALGSGNARPHQNPARFAARGFDVLIGINLLREGLDLPEVSLVAILDADKEGFLRSTTSLIQTIGRCARHIEGRAILYADRRTDSMNQASTKPIAVARSKSPTTRRTTSPQCPFIKSVDMELARIVEADYVTVPVDDASLDAATANIKSEQQLAEMLQQLETQIARSRQKV